MHEDTARTQRGSSFESTTRQIDIVTLLDVIMRSGLSGELQLRGPERTLHCFLEKGRCFFIAFGEETASSLLDFLAEVVLNREILPEILKFGQTYPLYMADALESAGIQPIEVKRRIGSLINEGIFWSVFFSEGEIAFIPVSNQLLSFTRDPKMQELILDVDRGNTEDMVCEMRLIGRHLHKSLAWKSGTPTTGSLDDILVTACKNGSLVGHVLQLARGEAWQLYQKMIAWFNEGLIEFHSEDRQEISAAFTGSERMIASIFDVFRSVLPLFFASRTKVLNEHEKDIFNTVLQRDWSSQYSELKLTKQLTDLGEFFDSFSASIDFIPAPEKLVYVRTRLHSLLMYLLLEFRMNGQAHIFREIVERIQGFLAFIRGAGTFEQKELSDIIRGLLGLVALASPTEKSDEAASPPPVAPSNHISEVATIVSSRATDISSLLAAGRIIDAFDIWQAAPDGVDLALQTELCERILSLLREEIGPRTLSVQVAPTALSRLASLDDISDSEGFLLSRMDSRMSIGDLIIVSGMKDACVYRYLLKFKQRELILIGDVSGGSRNHVGEVSVSSSRPHVPDKAPAEVSSNANGVNPVPSATNKACILSAQDQGILRSLKQEYDQLFLMTPHEMFKLSASATISDFEQCLDSLRNRYQADYFSPELRETVQPLMLKIMTLVEEAAVIVREYFSNVVSQPVQSASPVPESEDSAIEIVREPDIQKEPAINVVSVSLPPEQKPVLKSRPQPPPLPDRKVKAIELQSAALKARGKGDFKEEIDLLQEALKLTPENFSLHRALEEAKSAFQTDLASQLVEEATTLLHEGKVKKAAKLLQEALDYDETNVAHITLLAQVLATIPERRRDAVNLCMKILQMEPGNAEIYLLLGRLYKAEGKLVEARAAFQDAMRWDSGLKEARIEFNSLP